MHQLKLSRVFLMVACAIGPSACNSADGIVQAAPIPTATGPTVSRVGIEGLKEDIAWARSLPADVRLGTSDGPMSRDQLVSNLESALRGVSTNSNSRRLDLSPSSARHDYSPGDVGGGAVMYYLGKDANGLRWVRLYAYTQCNQASMVVSTLELKADWFNFQTGAHIFPWIIFPSKVSAPNYVSGSSDNAIGGTVVARAQSHNKHICEFGPINDYPFKYSDVFTVV